MKFVVQIPCGCGLVLLWWRYDTSCTSGFMDDITYDRNGPYGDAWLAALWYRSGVWCLWMPYLCYNSVNVWLDLLVSTKQFVGKTGFFARLHRSSDYVVGNIVSKITYNVSSLTVNPTLAKFVYLSAVFLYIIFIQSVFILHYHFW